MSRVPLTVESLEEIKSTFYTNPRHPVTNIGDPYILKTSDGKYYCYATSAVDGYLVWESPDLVNWTEIGYAYRVSEKSWGITNLWAPEVVEYNGKYYMYYSATWFDKGSLRIGVAVSNNPEGPFEDVESKPLFDFGYAAIDANVLLDNGGKKYLYFSRDCSENIIDGRHESHIYGIELDENMVSVVGNPVLLTKPEQDWELRSGPEYYWNEGPEVVKNQDTYYLMYSANFYNGRDYSIGYATSKTPLGPYVKYDNNPILSAGEYENISGTGHHSFTSSPDGKEMIIGYHSHINAKLGEGDRQLNIDRMGFRSDGSIFVNGPTIGMQPYPFSSERTNIALESSVEVNNQKDGYSKDRLIDGEFGVHIKQEEREWVGKCKDGKVSITLRWDKEITLESILLYRSVLPERDFKSYKLIIDDKYEVSELKLPESFEERAVIASFKPLKAKKVEIVIQSDKSEVGLSEIMVIGK